MLDLFCGRWGWSRAFAARGWECWGIDIVRPRDEDIPVNCAFEQRDVLTIPPGWVEAMKFDFICASSPCEEFSVHGMKHFHTNPKYPEMGIKLFEHTRAICEASGVPFVMENVRPAQKFVGKAVSHCGSFYLWGNAVPAILPCGITKGFRHKEMFAHDRTNRALQSATIPPELASCVADYATRICSERLGKVANGGSTKADATEDRVTP